MPLLRHFILLAALWRGILIVPAAQPLNVFIWSEYLDPEVVADFERQFDAKVTIDLYEDGEAMLAKLQSGGSRLYDIVVPSDYLVPIMVKLGLLAPLRHERIPNLANLETRFRSPPFDPKNQYTAAYQWGTVGIYYRKKAGTAAPDSWNVIFEPDRQWGPFVLIDSMRDTIGAALKYRGHSLNSVEPAELKEARDLLINARGRAIALEASVGGKNRVLARTAAAAIVYSGEAARGMAEDKETAYVIPREGSEIWTDSLAIPAQAPHRDLAETFVNFLLDPKVGARISNYTQFATPNRESRALIRAEDQANPAIYPPKEVMERLEFVHDVGAKTRIYDQIWTQVKAR